MTLSLRHAISPAETRTLDTGALRDAFLVPGLFVPGRIETTYSPYDRTIVGGAVPVDGPLRLESSKEVGSASYLERREMGVVNTGGPGTVSVGGQNIDLERADCAYLPMGSGEVSFSSGNGEAPARFYFVSTPAHHAYELRHISPDEANRLDLGDPTDCNQRVLRQYIHPDVCSSCQLTLGITEIKPGSVWNTMPCHTHNRRSEVYLYFDMEPQTRVFHFMGEPAETRHMVVANEQVVLSPGWSVHCGAGTGSYAFVWAMAGDNQDFTDMDFVAMEDLR